MKTLIWLPLSRSRSLIDEIMLTTLRDCFENLSVIVAARNDFYSWERENPTRERA